MFDKDRWNGQVVIITPVLDRCPRVLPYLVEQLLAGGRGLDRELQLRVHRRDAHIYLQIEYFFFNLKINNKVLALPSSYREQQTI